MLFIAFLLCYLKAAQTNAQRSLIRQLLELKQSHNTVGTTKNISAKDEGAFDPFIVTRWLKKFRCSDCKNIDD